VNSLGVSFLWCRRPWAGRRRLSGADAFGAAAARGTRRALFALLLGLGLFFPLVVAFGGSPAANSASPAARWITWHTRHFFTACEGNCAVSLFGGPQVLTHMTHILNEGASPPWDWRLGNAGLAGAAISRRLLTLWHALAIEPEVGLAKRFGAMHADEAWLALYFRWTRFPWNRTVRTSIALSVGLSYAADLPPGSHGAAFLNYCSPEVTFALPNHPRYELLVQLHHRSGLWIGNAADPGWQYLTIGLRYHL
jgi:hypothetical protein